MGTNHPLSRRRLSRKFRGLQNQNGIWGSGPRGVRRGERLKRWSRAPQAL